MLISVPAKYSGNSHSKTTNGQIRWPCAVKSISDNQVSIGHVCKLATFSLLLTKLAQALVSAMIAYEVYHIVYWQSD